MKLRKAAKNALLDLDDPLETDSDFTSNEYEYLSDVAEEDEDYSEDEEAKKGSGEEAGECGDTGIICEHDSELDTGRSS